MKYYCKNCGSEFKTGFESYLDAGGLSYPKEELEDILIFTDKCPYCEFELVEIPDYETPEQYEKRTGKAYSDDGLMWLFGEDIGQWYPRQFIDIKYSLHFGSPVIADPPVPPPDGWMPE